MRRIRTERKSLGTIYHFTDSDSFEQMIDKTSITMKSDRGYISFTRAWNLADTSTWMSGVGSLDVRIAFNDLISDRYKVVPFLDIENLPDDARQNPKFYEAEEAIQESPITLSAKTIEYVQYQWSPSMEDDFKATWLYPFHTENDIPYFLNERWLSPIELRKMGYISLRR